MSKTDEILAKMEALNAELEIAKKEERAKELAVIKEKIKLFGFKTSDFRGLLVTRKKQGTTTRKAAVKAPKKV